MKKIFAFAALTLATPGFADSPDICGLDPAQDCAGAVEKQIEQHGGTIATRFKGAKVTSLLSHQIEADDMSPTLFSLETATGKIISIRKV